MVRLQLVGGGRMGEALVGGLLASGWCQPGELLVVERLAPRRDQLVERFPGVAVAGAMAPSDGAVIAVKPGDVPAAVAELAAFGVPRVLSIAAGVTLAALESAFAGAGAATTPVVRAMPNTPALVGAGASAISVGSPGTELEFAL